MANMLWAAGTNGYLAAVLSLLTTELDGLANDTMSAGGTARDNSALERAIWADFEFLAGGGFSPAAGAHIQVWLLRSLDGGTSYEDGSSAITPPRQPDVIIPIRQGTTITPRAGRPGIILPPGHFTPIAKNKAGAGLPASGNVIRMRTYAMAI